MFPYFNSTMFTQLINYVLRYFINTFHVLYFHNNVIVIAYFQQHAMRSIILGLLMCRREVRLLSARRQHNQSGNTANPFASASNFLLFLWEPIYFMFSSCPLPLSRAGSAPPTPPPPPPTPTSNLPPVPLICKTVISGRYFPK